MPEDTATPTADLAHFENHARRRLYRLLVVHAEKAIDKVERKDAIVPRDVLLNAHALLLAAQTWKDPAPDNSPSPVEPVVRQHGNLDTGAATVFGKDT